MVQPIRSRLGGRGPTEPEFGAMSDHETSEEPTDDGSIADARPDRKGRRSDDRPSESAPSKDERLWWLSFAEEMIDEGLDRDEQFDVTVENLEVDVPARFGEDAPAARWRFDGRVSVRIDGTRGPLAEWLQFWAAQESNET